MSALKATSRVERGGPASGGTATAEQVGNAVRGAGSSLQPDLVEEGPALAVDATKIVHAPTDQAAAVAAPIAQTVQGNAKRPRPQC